MTRKQALLRLSQVQFAAWELHVYLDTHPDDMANGNEWLKDPWPWENAKESDC